MLIHNSPLQNAEIALKLSKRGCNSCGGGGVGVGDSKAVSAHLGEMAKVSLFPAISVAWHFYFGITVARVRRRSQFENARQFVCAFLE